MTAIAKATSRIRHIKGNSYLTHGDDSYDKRGLNHARRGMDRAIINEWLEEGKEEATEPISGPVTFRVVMITQVYENYGAHNWDGKGECPSYWKAKGGHECHHALGSANDVLDLGKAGIDAIVRQMASQVTRWDEYFDEYVIGWEIVPSNEKTQHEEWDEPFRSLN